MVNKALHIIGSTVQMPVISFNTEFNVWHRSGVCVLN